MSDMTSTQAYRGDRSRSFNERTSPAMMPGIQGPGSDDIITIVGLDKGATWRLSPGDSTYVETLFSDIIDTTTPIVDDRQSLDSFLYEPPKLATWNSELFEQKPDTLFGMPCLVTRSRASSIEPVSGKKNIASCELWVVADVDYFSEIVSYNDRLCRMTGISPNYQLEAYSELLSQFSVTFADLSLDTIRGNPVRIDLSVQIVLSQDDADELKNKLADSLPDAIPGYTDSLIEALAYQMSQSARPGKMDLIGINYEITSIDTVTVLPDSLFEIPAGFTKR